MLEDTNKGICIPQSVAGLESPSLTGAGTGSTAYEMKFLVSVSMAEMIQRWTRERLAVDPHADATNNDSYETTTLYLDTPNYDVFQRTPGFRRRKYRVRRYNGANNIFAECKTRRGNKVTKQRCVLPLEEFSRFELASSEPNWSGADYHLALSERRLRPSCRMTYERSAYLGRNGSGAVRLTLDRRIRGVLCDAWNTTPLTQATNILAEEVICELKFLETLPHLFKQLVAEFRLETSSVSKYRRMLTALGLTMTNSEPTEQLPNGDGPHV